MADNKQDDDNYVDEFSEDAFVDPKGDDADADWSDDEYVDDESADETAALPEKKKSKLSNVIIVAVVLVLAVGYFLFAGGSSNEPTSTGTETEVADENDVIPKEIDLEPQTDKAAAVEGTTDQGFMVEGNPEKLVSDIPVEKTAPSDADAVPPQAAPTTTVDGSTVQPSADLPDTKPVELSEPAPSPAEFPTVDKILKPQPDTKLEKIAEPVVVPTEPQAVGVAEPEPVVAPTEPQAVDATMTPVAVSPAVLPVVPPAVLDDSAVMATPVYKDLADKLANEQAKAADLQKRLDVAASAAEKVDATDVEVLKNKIATLEQQLLEKQEGGSVADTATSKSSAVEKTDKASVPQVAPTVKPQSAPVSSSPWILKAASAGRALISHAGGTDLKTVYVGDIVEPIGKIVAIENGASGWKIKGTKGTISQ